MQTQEKLTYVALPKKNQSGAIADVYYGTRTLATLYAPNRYERKVHVIMVTTAPNFTVQHPIHAECISLYVCPWDLDHALRGLASLLPPL